MSTIRWMCSIPTGHPSSHHPHVVHPHTASSVATCVIMSGPFHAGASARSAALPLACRGQQERAPCPADARAVRSRGYLGLSVLPVLTVGQLIVQRPHSRHDAMSSSCFHVYCSTCETPKVSAFSKSLIGASRPRGPMLRKKRFSGAKIRWRSLVNGKQNSSPNTTIARAPATAIDGTSRRRRARLRSSRSTRPTIGPFGERRDARVDARAFEHQSR